mgnify:CR=1 FL=1
MSTYLGIEIGGTKLQLGVSAGDGSPLLALERREVDIARGAQAIRDDIVAAGLELKNRFDIKAVGFGFGGPIDAKAGVITASHQVQGWDGFPIVKWCEEALGLPVFLGNDCDMAALAEARFGAGRGSRCVFYVTVGTGIGGGLVIDGQVHGSDRPAAAEPGHLTPRHAPDGRAVEWQAGGTSLARRDREMVEAILSQRETAREQSHAADAVHTDDLLQRASSTLTTLTARQLADAASAGNTLALRILRTGTDALGWAIAQVITLIAPDTIVVGGGVSLMGESLFYKPLRETVARHVFAPLRGSFEIVVPALGEEVVVHGAAAMARSRTQP